LKNRFGKTPKYKTTTSWFFMAFDDPVVIILILAVVVLLFGAGRIPAFAKSLGQAKREFDKAMKGNFDEPAKPETTPQSVVSSTPEDPLVEAAKKEGIDTTGKTKQEIASALSWKLIQMRK
jgi:sec-independent protein translocase protein TatA